MVRQLAGAGLLILLLAACGRRDVVPTARPTLTLTPFSTPLAYPPTAIPLGSADNPLKIVLMPPLADEANAQAEMLSQRLSDATGVEITVVLAQRPSEAIAALCDSLTGDAAVGIVDAVGYAIVRAKGCAAPVAWLETTTNPSFQMEQSVFVSKADEALAAVETREKPFCRVSADDFYGWTLPLLELSTRELDSKTLGTLRDTVTIDAAIEMVNEGDCWGMALPARLFDALTDAEDARIADWRIVDRTDRAPLGILMMPISVPLDIRQRLLDALIAVREDVAPAAEMTPDAEASPVVEATVAVEQTAQPDSTSEAANGLSLAFLASFVGETRFVPLDDADLKLFDTFLDTTRLDFAQMGQS